MAMKKRDTIDAVRRLLTESLRSGANKVGFVVAPPVSGAAAEPPLPLPRTPEFEFSGWQFFALDRHFEDEELNDGGDARLRAPDGTHIGLVWTATGKLTHRFDFSSMPMPMLYVDVPLAVSAWSELRPHFEALAPALEAELRSRAAQK